MLIGYNCRCTVSTWILIIVYTIISKKATIILKKQQLVILQVKCIFTMSYEQDGKTVGTLEYGEYDGKPNIKMIEVLPEYRRR